MELELNDVLKASSISVKFMAFQSPSSLPSSREKLPKSFYFIYRFYDKPVTHTERVHLQSSDDKTVAQDIQLAKKYHLILDRHQEFFSESKPTLDLIQDRCL